MKRKITAAILAALLCLFSVPVISGCSARCVYTLGEDEDGNKFYTLSYTGFATSLKGELVIPEYYGEGEDYAPVKAIADKGLAGTKLTKITIPATVTEIGVAAFAYNYSLTNVVFAEDSKVQEIPRGAFGYCQMLQSITLPDSVNKIDAMAFYECSELSSIQMPDGVTNIGESAFENCVMLSGIILPASLETIGDLAFYKSGLKEVTIPDSVHDVVVPVLDENGEQLLDDDGNPVNDVTYGMGYGVFHSCTSLKSAKVGSGIKILKSGVFGYCTALEEIYLPAGLEEVEGAYFYNGKVYYGHAFHNDTSLTDVYFGGTSEQWTALLSNVENTYYSEQGAVYDNSALLKATVHYI